MSNIGHRPHEPEFSAGGRHAARGDDDHDKPADKLDRPLILASVARDARLDRKFILLITLSALIATLGLLQGSTAVVIGAMLVSPLLGPIMGIGFGLATIDSALIKRSLTTIAAGMAAAIAVSIVLILLSPVHDVTTELTARTQPTLLDLGVAVVGGIAGVYAILRKLAGVMVGVSIATALVPPLCTIGFGLATGRTDFAIGAALLFLTNTLAIAFAATLVARLNRFGPSLTPQHTLYQVAGIVAVLGVLSIPLGVSLNRLVREAGARTLVQGELRGLLGPQDRIDTLNVALADGQVKVDGVLLVAAYDAGLPNRLKAAAEPKLGRPVSAAFVQLRQEQGRSSEAVRSLTERVTRLEAQADDGAAIVRALTAPGLLDREAIAVDAQARLVTIQRGQADAARLDAALTALRAAFPDWQIAEAAPAAAGETER